MEAGSINRLAGIVWISASLHPTKNLFSHEGCWALVFRGLGLGSPSKDGGGGGKRRRSSFSGSSNSSIGCSNV